MRNRRILYVIAGIAISFGALAGVIIFLAKMGIVSGATAGLMLVALFGIYLGFGVLVGADRLVNKLK